LNNGDWFFEFFAGLANPGDLFVAFFVGAVTKVES